MGKVLRRLFILIFGLAVLGGLFGGPTAVVVFYLAGLGVCIYLEINANSKAQDKSEQKTKKNSTE